MRYAQISESNDFELMLQGVTFEDLQGTSSIYESVVSGTHYIRNEEALRSMGWHGSADKCKSLADEERQRFRDAGLPVPKFYEAIHPK